MDPQTSITLAELRRHELRADAARAHARLGAWVRGPRHRWSLADRLRRIPRNVERAARQRDRRRLATSQPTG